MSYPVNNLPTKAQEARDVEEASRKQRDGNESFVCLWKTETKYNPDDWMKYQIRISYNGCNTIDLKSATIEGIGSQLIGILREARDRGYQQAQEDIQRSLGLFKSGR